MKKIMKYGLSTIVGFAIGAVTTYALSKLLKPISVSYEEFEDEFEDEEDFCEKCDAACECKDLNCNCATKEFSKLSEREEPAIVDDSFTGAAIDAIEGVEPKEAVEAKEVIELKHKNI